MSCKQERQFVSQYDHVLFAVTAGSGVMQWVMGNVKLALEWLTIPLFVIALQLPLGAVWYWLSSTLTAMLQVSP